MRRIALVAAAVTLIVPVVSTVAPAGAQDGTDFGSLTIRLRTPTGETYTDDAQFLAAYTVRNLTSGVYLSGLMATPEITVPVRGTNYLTVGPPEPTNDWVTQWWPLAGSQFGAEPITIPPGRSRTVDVAIHPAVTMRGSADDGRGNNCGATIYRLEANGFVTRTPATERRGTSWQARGLPGRYRVRSGCRGRAEPWFDGEDFYRSAEVLSLDRGATISGIDLDVSGRGARIGVIAQPSSEALEGRPVCADLWSDDGHRLDRLPTLTRGRHPFGPQSGLIFFDGIPPGIYRLSISDCFRQQIQLAYAGGRPSLPGSKRVKVGRGDEVIVEIPAARTGALCHGRVATIEGTPGDDQLIGTSGPDIVVAHEGDDRLKGRDGGDWLCGGPGDDVLVGDRGHDLLDGGLGADIHRGDNGRDRLVASKGADENDGGRGIDRIDHRWSPMGVTVDLLTGVNRGGTARNDTTANIELIGGSPHDDRLRGDDGDNALNGRGGTDLLNGRGGTDTCLNGETTKNCETR